MTRTSEQQPPRSAGLLGESSQFSALFRRTVLAALNDHLESLGPVDLQSATPMPALLADTGLTDQEIYDAVRDLDELKLVEATPVPEIKHPIAVNALTARGRQELP